jgi:membrane protease YdiL (CAAX protease family)
MSEPEKNTNVAWNSWDVFYILVFVFFINTLVKYLGDQMGMDFQNALTGGIMQLLLSFIPIIAIVIYLKIIYNPPILKSLGLNIPKDKLKSYIIGGINISFLILISSMIVMIGFSLFNQAPLTNPYENYSIENLRVISILAILISPLYEEIVFRGFMQPAFCKTFGNIPGIFGVAIIFSLLHYQYLSYPHALMVIFILSLILGFARWHFGSTVPGIIGHLLNNVYATMSLFLGGHA